MPGYVQKMITSLNWKNRAEEVGTLIKFERLLEKYICAAG